MRIGGAGSRTVSRVRDSDLHCVLIQAALNYSVVERREIQLPAAAVCRRYGLRDGDEQEAFQSNNKYVQDRLQEISDAEILRIARELHNSTGDHDLSEILAKLDEQKAWGVTELTRRRVGAELQTLDIPG